ncbi:MAG: Rne/Rng family ribonuclease [Pseudomonadota bacterium]
MSKKMLIDATHAEETRVVVVDGNKVEEFDFESENKRQISGNIYLAKITRVEPSLQAAFVDYGGNRHGFLAFSEIHPDYYQIPVADREALIAEEMAIAREEAEEEEKPKRRRRRSRGKAAQTETTDETVSTEVPDEAVSEADVDTSPEGDAAETAEENATPEADAVEAEAQPEAVDNADDTAKDIPGMDVVDVEDDADAEEQPYVAMDSASEKDETIEAVADDDTAEEIRRPSRQRARRYKIQEVIKVRQILLVQVVKEERGNKGAALTTYLSLAGRYCVLMPNTARGGGISRKITNATDRKKLKEIATEIEVPTGAGLIIRTAGAKRTKTEIKRDYEYLQRMWEQIRELTLKSIAPAQIYEEGNLIKRSIRDLYGREIDEVMVEGTAGYRTAKDFMKMIMPSHAKNVKPYTDPMPLFARYQVETYLAGMFNPVVQLKSGGYIVIGVTEALVAIDVNSGKATKEASIEETALKTNLEAAEEVARQLRLRDLAGLIVIDFIDMEERKNNAAVEKRFKERLKTDRARIQVGRISGFGLLEMSRQRLRPGMLEASTQPCPSCHGTGLIRSDDSVGLTILRQLEEEGVRRRSREVLVKAPVSIVNFLMNMKREHIAQIEARYGMAVRLEADPHLIAPDFMVEKFKTATRNVQAIAEVISVDASLMEELDEEIAAEEAAEPQESTEAVETNGEEEDRPKKKRRRRRRRRGKGGDAQSSENGQEASSDNGEAEAAPQEAEAASEEASQPVEEQEKPKRRRTRRKKPEEAEASEGASDEAQSEAAPAETHETAEPAEAAEQAEKPKRRRTRKKKEPEVVADPAPAEASDAPAEQTEPESEPVEAATPEPAPEPSPEPVSEAPAAPEPEAATAKEEPEPAMATATPEPEPEPAQSDKPRRKGWWSIGR